MSARVHVQAKSASSVASMMPAPSGVLRPRWLEARGASPLGSRLTMDQPGDRYEQEADRVADQIMRMPEPALQRQVDEGDEEEELLQAKPLVQRRVAGAGGGSPAPPILHEPLCSPGQPLHAPTRASMESRLGHDFGQVRVHSDAQAAMLAAAAGAQAYTLGHDLVFGANQYAPERPAGRRLLAHELTHVVQQEKRSAGASDSASRVGTPLVAAEQEARQSASHIMAGGFASPGASVVPGTIQRDDGGGGGTGSEDERYRLRWPGMGQGPFPRIRLAPELELRLDPETEAQIAAMRAVREFLDPDRLRSSLLRADFDTLLSTQPPPWLTTPPTPAPAPLVPRGPGPAAPRAATGGDVVRAILRIPAVDSALTALRTQAAEQARQDWRRLSAGERALVITQSALIGGGALAGVLSSPEARGFALDLIQNRDIPIPGVPGLTFQFNATGPNQMIRFDLNVGSLLPPSLGFR